MHDVEFRGASINDVDTMFSLLEESMSKYLYINEIEPKKNLLIIDRRSVEEYVSDKRFYTKIAEVNETVVGWISGSSDPMILDRHRCLPGDFYIEEIIIDSNYRRRGIGSSLLKQGPMVHSRRLIVDTPSANLDAIRFYENMGFTEVSGLPHDFTAKWKRMEKIR